MKNKRDQNIYIFICPECENYILRRSIPSTNSYCKKCFFKNNKKTNTSFMYIIYKYAENISEEQQPEQQPEEREEQPEQTQNQELNDYPKVAEIPRVYKTVKRAGNSKGVSIKKRK